MMEDILFIMKNKNKSLPSYILKNEQYKLIKNYHNPVRHEVEIKKNDNSFQIILPIESILDDNYLINADGVLEYKNRRCSHCTSKKYS